MYDNKVVLTQLSCVFKNIFDDDDDDMGSHYAVQDGLELGSS